MKLFNNDHTVDLDVADALSELGNVGVGKATRTLSAFMGERIALHPPRVLSLRAGLESIAGIDPGETAVGILMRLTKTLEGIVLILAEPDYIAALVERLTGLTLCDEELLENEDAISAIQEIANIMAASYMTAVGAYTGLRIYLTPMMVGLDLTAALISYPLAEMSMSGENVICIDSSFFGADKADAMEVCSGRMLILPDESSVDKILRALGPAYEGEI